MTTEGDLMDRLVARDLSAWGELVGRYAPTMWVVARSHRLSRSDAADAVQHTWAALAENLPRLTTPDRLRAWLVTTVRRESMRLRERRLQERATDEVTESGVEHGPEPAVMHTVRERAFREAFEALPDRCRVLLALHANAPELSYAQLAVSLEMNAASVGRTRSRCLEHLRRLMDRNDPVNDLAEPA